MLTTIEIDVEVIGTCTPGEAASWDYPGSGPEVEIEAVLLVKGDTKVDLLSALPDELLEALEEELLEQGDYEYPDDDDAAYDRMKEDG